MIRLRATARLQLHKDFTLDDALQWVDYWAALGISHLYVSPLLTARPGSMHGYDVTDPSQINPELGGEAALRRLVDALRARDMGLILDIVSNHMAVGGSNNPWWLDVLEWGRRSPYGEFFDIHWDSPDPLLEGQLLLPYLRSDYGEVLRAGEIPLRLDAGAGAFYCEHFEHRFPINPHAYGELLRLSGDAALDGLAQRFDGLADGPEAHAEALGLRSELAMLLADPRLRQSLEAALSAYDSRQPEGLQRLHQLLERQSYRLASWRTAADDINWRRFFDINELGGLRVERPEVFEATHAKVFQLVGEGLIDGLRIDHVDGLADPRGYCRRLRRRVEALLPQRPEIARIEHFSIHVEKILASGEQLHGDWMVDGTTGYEFMNQVSLLQHDPQGAAPLARLWNARSGRPAEFLQEARQARAQVLAGSLAGDFESVAQLLLQIARADLMTRDITLGAIRRALQALVVHFPVYRCYIAGNGRQNLDEGFFEQALDGARGILNEADAGVLEHLQKWLGGVPLRQIPTRLRKLHRQACARFQQLTSPAAAKAVEDTAFYRYGVLLSRNDVGFDSEYFSAPPEAFHRACAQRLESFPDSLLATATHDHKRGEDGRARLAVLSERGEWYSTLVEHWQRLTAGLRRLTANGEAPYPGDELILFQTLLGSWPLELSCDDPKALAVYFERVSGWQQKALREAKLRSSWSAPDTEYEQVCRDYLHTLLCQPDGLPLRRSIASAVNDMAASGALNGLVQCLLRLTAPGVPDLFQGREFWDFSLVDPDNRRPVDYPARAAALAQIAEPAELLRNWRDGRIKQYLISSLLCLRRSLPTLFARGEYLPLNVLGTAAGRALAFARCNQDGHCLLVVVPRLSDALLADGVPMVPPRKWGNTRVQLPESLRDRPLYGLFGQPVVSPRDGSLLLSELLSAFPVCVLSSEPARLG